MKNWKTTVAGIIAVAAYAVGIFLPNYKVLADSMATAILGGGLIAAADAAKK